MRAKELTDDSINLPNAQIVIELPNGQQLATKDYYYGTNKKGESTIVIVTGREIKSK